MNEFAFLYRGATKARSPEETQKVYKKWYDWFETMKTKGTLVSIGHPLENEGKVVSSPSSVSDGPFAEAKDLVGGFSLIQAKNLAEAAEIARGCPIFETGGQVEVRQIKPVAAA